ncbi:MAG: RICIN domain-containing protein [Candidatus Omnitrophota bacterium]
MAISGTHNLQILRGLTSNRSLLSCQPSGAVVDLWMKDDSSGRQRWQFIPITGMKDVYNIKIAGGMTTNRKYLSCTSDGTKVDLWSVDDGSGRQRWVVTPVKNSPTCNTYLIKIFGGVSTARKYLSCTPDGIIVDLWTLDDNSGRQRWQLQEIWAA